MTIACEYFFICRPPRHQYARPDDQGIAVNVVCPEERESTESPRAIGLLFSDKVARAVEGAMQLTERLKWPVVMTSGGTNMLPGLIA